MAHLQVERLVRFWATNPLYFCQQKVGPSELRLQICCPDGTTWHERFYADVTTTGRYIALQKAIDDHGGVNGKAVVYTITLFLDAFVEQNQEKFLVWRCGVPHIPLAQQSLQEAHTLSGLSPTVKFANPPTNAEEEKQHKRARLSAEEAWYSAFAIRLEKAATACVGKLDVVWAHDAAVAESQLVAPRLLCQKLDTPQLKNSNGLSGCSDCHCVVFKEGSCWWRQTTKRTRQTDEHLILAAERAWKAVAAQSDSVQAKRELQMAKAKLKHVGIRFENVPPVGVGSRLGPAWRHPLWTQPLGSGGVEVNIYMRIHNRDLCMHRDVSARPPVL